MKCSPRRCRPTASCSFGRAAHCITLPSKLLPLIVLPLLVVPLGARQTLDGRSKNFRAASELVTTAVTVRDAEGRLVTALEQKDFTIEEDGVPQPITQFTRERVPVSLSLALDISDSMRGQRMLDARTALAHFLDRLLKIEDEASLVGFNHEARLFGAWTTDKGGMRVRLDEMKPSGGTAMYDAVDVSLPLFESRQHTRAAIVLVSEDRKSTRLNSSHSQISYAVFCLKK